MPFDEEDIEQPSIQSKKVGLKQVSPQKSIFDNSFKNRPTQDQLDSNAKKIEQQKLSYKEQAAEMSFLFKKIMKDKTLPQNKNVFMRETEAELLGNMIKLAVTVNNDEYEEEGMGSLIWVILLLKTCLWQSDRINQLEYTVSENNNKLVQILEQLKVLDSAEKNG